MCWFRVFCSLSETITAPFFFRRSPVKSTTLTQQMGGRTAFVERAHARTHAIARHLFFFRLQNKKSALMVILPLPRLTLVRAPLLLPNPKLAPAHAPVPASASRTNWGVFTHPLTHSLYRWHGGVVPPPPPSVHRVLSPAPPPGDRGEEAFPHFWSAVILKMKTKTVLRAQQVVGGWWLDELMGFFPPTFPSPLPLFVGTALFALSLLSPRYSLPPPQSGPSVAIIFHNTGLAGCGG